jgi:hypothetical protein
MEKKLQHQQLVVIKQERYLIERIYEYRSIILMALFPALIWGGRIVGIKTIGKIIKQLVKLGFLTSVTYAKQQLFLLPYRR